MWMTWTSIVDDAAIHSGWLDVTIVVASSIQYGGRMLVAELRSRLRSADTRKHPGYPAAFAFLAVTNQLISVSYVNLRRSSCAKDK